MAIGGSAWRSWPAGEGTEVLAGWGNVVAVLVGGDGSRGEGGSSFVFIGRCLPLGMQSHGEAGGGDGG